MRSLLLLALVFALTAGCQPRRTYLRVQVACWYGAADLEVWTCPLSPEKGP